MTASPWSTCSFVMVAVIRALSVTGMRASTVPGPLIVTGTAPSATGTVSTAAAYPSVR